MGKNKSILCILFILIIVGVVNIGEVIAVEYLVADVEVDIKEDDKKSTLDKEDRDEEENLIENISNMDIENHQAEKNRIIVGTKNIIQDDEAVETSIEDIEKEELYDMEEELLLERELVLCQGGKSVCVLDPDYKKDKEAPTIEEEREEIEAKATLPKTGIRENIQVFGMVIFGLGIFLKEDRLLIK